MNKKYCCSCGFQGHCDLFIDFDVKTLGPLCDDCYEAAITAARLTKKQIDSGFEPKFDDSEGEVD